MKQLEAYKKFLLSIGVPQATIDAMETDAKLDASALDITKFSTDFKAAQKALAENDSELIGRIQAAEKGKQLDIVTRKLKATFNLTPELVKDKGIEDIITLAKTESTKGLDKTAQDLQLEITGLNTKIKEFEDVKIPALLAEKDTFVKGFNIEAKIQKMLTDKKLRVPISAAYPSVKSALLEMYDLELNDKNELIAYQKGTKLQPKSTDGTKLLGVADIVQTQLETFQFIEKSNGTNTQTTTTTQPTNEEGKKKESTLNIPHQDAAMKHLDDIKKQTAESAAK
jgi:hypothetical protein